MRSLTFIFLTLVLQLLHCRTAFARLDRKSSFRAPAASRTIPGQGLYPANVLASRQHHQNRPLLDVCASIDTDNILQGDLLGIPLQDLVDLDLCLCLSALPLALDLNTHLKALSNKYGQSVVDAVITALINTSTNSQRCAYPPHSQQICSDSDPCGFTCDSPYVKQGDLCVCASPNTVCNGVCGHFPQGCGSAIPRSLHVRSDGYSYSLLTDEAAAQASCKEHEIVCGVFGGSSNSFECIDTNRTLESCGGCVIPNPFLEGAHAFPIGRDCTAIEGADRVSCVMGSCVVQMCSDGWTLNESGDACVQIHGSASVSTASNPVAQVMERAKHVVRAPHVSSSSATRAQPKEKDVGGKIKDEFSTGAWF